MPQRAMDLMLVTPSSECYASVKRSEDMLGSSLGYHPPVRMLVITSMVLRSVLGHWPMCKPSIANSGRPCDGYACRTAGRRMSCPTAPACTGRILGRLNGARRM